MLDHYPGWTLYEPDEFNWMVRIWSDFRELLGGFSKADLRSAVDATDVWIENNQASYNNALPEPLSPRRRWRKKLCCSVQWQQPVQRFVARQFGRKNLPFRVDIRRQPDSSRIETRYL